MKIKKIIYKNLDKYNRYRLGLICDNDDII